MAYAAHCVACHGADERGESAAALSGDLFWLHWETKSVERLFHKIRDTMPRRRGSAEIVPISDQDKLDIVAHLLQRNGFPAGTQELAADPGLATLEIVPRAGPSPPRTGTVVQATGCLEQRDGRWLLTSSTPPQITMMQPSSPDELKEAASAAPGNGTIELISVFPSPAPHLGHRLLAKGLFIVNPARHRINVTSIEMIAESCTP